MQLGFRTFSGPNEMRAYLSNLLKVAKTGQDLNEARARARSWGAVRGGGWGRPSQQRGPLQLRHGAAAEVSHAILPFALPTPARSTRRPWCWTC
jgi:hypothetical protein